MGSPEPAAFLSYVRADDHHDNGLISQLRDQLSAEVRIQTGQHFPIFQDRTDIAWGQNWKARIEETLDTVTVLIPVITPGFFTSTPCREELTRFLAQEARLSRGDLILPVYYVSTPFLDDPAIRDADPQATTLAARQYADWRELRFEPFTAPPVRKALAQLAQRMRETFWHRPHPPTHHTPPATPGPTTATASSPTTSPKQVSASSAVAKHEPPTHVVDPFHRGDFITISAAIQAADPGDRILVRPGLYQEALVLAKPLEIIGQGPVEEIIIQTRDTHVLWFSTNIGRVTNLTIRQLGGDSLWFGVDITQGRLELEDCDITSHSGSCVTIRDGADPRLRRNHIHHSQAEGVYVYDNGLGTLEDNDITDNSYPGVEIKTGGNPTLRRNRINGNGDGDEAVWVRKGGGGVIEENDLTGNTRGAWDIEIGAGNLTRARNTEK